MKLRDDEQMQTRNYDSYGRHFERISGSILAQAGTNSHADTRPQSTPGYNNSLFYERPGRTMSGETMIAQETSWPKPSSPKYGDDDVKPVLDQPRIRTNDISATHSICSPSKALVYGSRPRMMELDFEDASVEYMQAQ